MIIVKLHELAWEHNVKGYEIAQATGLSEATISKLTKGKHIDVKLSTINKLCIYFKCNLQDILEYVADK